MTYHRTSHEQIGEHYGVPGQSPRVITRVLGEGCGALGGLGASKTELKLAMGSEITLFDKLNLDASRVLAPFQGVINALPMSLTDKRKLLGSPLNFAIDLFDPIEDAVGRAVDRVLAQKGNTQRPFWASNGVNLQRVKSTDSRLDSVTRNIVKRLRTANAFLVLTYTQPVELATECVREGLNISNAILRRIGLAGYGGGLGSPDAGAAETGVLAALIAEYPLLSGAIMATLAGLVSAVGGALTMVVTSSGEAAAAAIAPKSTVLTQRPTLAPAFTATPVKIGPAAPGAPPIAQNQPTGSNTQTIAIVAGVAALAFLVVRARK